MSGRIWSSRRPPAAVRGTSSQLLLQPSQYTLLVALRLLSVATIVMMVVMLCESRDICLVFAKRQILTDGLTWSVLYLALG